MCIGEVLGKIGCDKRDDELLGCGLKIIRIYEGSVPCKVIVVKDCGIDPGNGDFVQIDGSSEAEYVIAGFADEYPSPYGVI